MGLISLTHGAAAPLQSCVNNGLTMDYFALERAERQGDSLSPYLFVVVVETLAKAIRQNTAIKGVTIGKEETKLLQYADDTTAVLSDMDSTWALFTLLDVFKELSGLRMGMWVGSSKSNKLKPFGIK